MVDPNSCTTIKYIDKNHIFTSSFNHSNFTFAFISYPSNDLNGRDRGVMNHVEQAFLGELADDARLAADNVPWPLFFLEELFYSQNCSFFED